jgi:putative membrane protein
MTFIDDLTLILDLLVLVTVLVFYTGFCVWFEYRRKDLDRANTHLRGGAAMLALIGGAIGIVALWGELTWPIPAAYGPYDLFFFDPLFLLALILVGFALAVWKGFPTHMVGIVSAVSGCGIIYYGIRGYMLGVTQDPLETLLLYLSLGAVAIAAFPATLFVDWFIVGPKNPSAAPLPSEPVPAYPRIWYFLVGGFLVLVVLAGIASVAYGFTAAWAHLASPP